MQRDSFVNRWALGVAAFLFVAAGACGQDAPRGLRGAFYQGNDARIDPSAVRPVLTRVDETLDLAWVVSATSSNPPPKETGSYWWGARWTGSLTPPAAGDYVFRVTADDCARVMLDGRLVVNGWGLKSGTTTTGEPVRLEAGRPLSLIVDLYQNLGDAGIRLLWQTPGATNFVTVPSACLSPSQPDAPLAATRARILARPGHAPGLAGGKITGSNVGPTTGFETIAVARVPPAEGEWLDLRFPTNATVYRYVKYEAPTGSWANVAEVEFLHGDTRLRGAGFGTVGSRAGDATWEKALDGDAATWFEAVDADNQYVGIDLGEAAQAAAPVFDPAPGSLAQGVYVRLASPTPGAFVRYVMKDVALAFDRGVLYTQEFPVRTNVTVIAQAFRPGLADSVRAIGTYRFNVPPLKDGPKVFKVGNSLTGNAWALLPAIAESMGYRLVSGGIGVAGAPTDWMWDHSRERAEKELAAKGPFDCLITQPFAPHGRSVSNEVTNTGNFLGLCRTRNPATRLYLYQQWPAPLFNDRWAQAKGDDLAPLKLTPAATWNEGVTNHCAYFAEVRRLLQERFPDPPVCIIPVGAALAELNTRITAGKVPGMKDFIAEIFADGIHLTAKGEYMVGLVHAACLLGVSPVDRALATGAGLTGEQAHIFQSIAWDAVVAEPFSGVKGSPRE